MTGLISWALMGKWRQFCPVDLNSEVYSLFLGEWIPAPDWVRCPSSHSTCLSLLQHLPHRILISHLPHYLSLKLWICWGQHSCSIQFLISKPCTRHDSKCLWNIYQILFYTSFCFMPVILNWDGFWPLEDTWHCLEIFLVITAGGCYWHIMGRGQECC